MTKKIDIAVIGVTTIIGETLIELLADRDFPVGKLFPLDAESECGGRVNFNTENLPVRDYAGFDFSQVDLAFVCRDGVPDEVVQKALAAGCSVLDACGQYRDESVCLIVPEVNAGQLDDCKLPALISNPAPVAIAVSLAVKAIDEKFPIRRLDVTGFISVSQSGRAGVEELATQTTRLLNVQPIEPDYYRSQIAFNVHGQTAAMDEDGYTVAERQNRQDIIHLLGGDRLVSLSLLRVPVFFGCGAQLLLRTEEAADISEITTLLEKFNGIELDAASTPVDIAGQDAVFIGRIRPVAGLGNEFQMWVATDNSRKGSALNSIQTAEILVKHYL